MNQHEKPKVTIVVVPRESLNLFPTVIERIYDVTEFPFEMVVMESHSPASVRRYLKRCEASRKNFRVLYSDRFLFPYEAVNQALPHLTTEFVVFIDNDVIVEKGWLSALVQCAIEEKVGCVHPIYLVGKLEERKIHVAEGRLIRRMRNGKPFVDSVMTYSGKRVDQIPDLRRKPSEFFEWHCVLFRKSLLDKVGALRPLTISEHLDYVFRMKKVREKILLEPKALVAYDYERVFKLRGADRNYFLFRWDPKKAEESLLDYCQKWGLHVDSMRARLGWGTAHWKRVNSTALHRRVLRKVKRLVGIPVKEEWLETANV